MSNRVIRKFVLGHGFNPCSFLRVQVGEENGLPFFAGDIDGSVEARMKTTILSGLLINGKSTNSLRSLRVS